MSFSAYLYVYLFGGVTFLPVVLSLSLLYVYLTLPSTSSGRRLAGDRGSSLLRNGDEKAVLRSGTDDLAEKFLRKHESDVAAGYFAVCREYVPGGVNGKPPERLSPAGETVASESPSVYQTMYRSIFDRVNKPSIEPNKDGAGKSVKRTNNVFYVVLRHGHLMLYDDIQQLEVRHVISLEYHDVDIYGGSDEAIPEPELWIKRNAIRLKRKKVHIGDKSSLPFYLFSENLSEKEDFYFALLNNMQKNLGESSPLPQEFDTSHIIALVQRLHSSEEQLQTRWLNALLGRLFLSVYKTPEVEAIIRQRLTKKIARVKKPDFITKLALQKIDTGTGAPFFTNLRLKDLTVNGDCTVEADVEYSGSFRVELAATVRIDLGKRLGAREVDIVLAATCKKLSGHVLGRLKPPPSNRLWVSFDKVPKVELKLEPIVSSRQITYGFILRAIENRILEVIAETIVLPFWDDIPFTQTTGERFRGGIWKKDISPDESTEIKDEVAEDEAEAGAEAKEHSINKDERIMSMPVLADSAQAAKTAAKQSLASLRDSLPESRDVNKTPDRIPRQAPPRILRSSSFASAADPKLSPSHAPAESAPIDMKAASKRDSMLKDLSARSLGTSPELTGQSPPKDGQTYVDDTRNGADSTTPNLLSEFGQNLRRDTADTDSTLIGSTISTTADEGSDAKRLSLHEDAKAHASPGTTRYDHQKTIASINAAKEAAQKWSWGVLARNRQKEAETRSIHGTIDSVDTSQPMGRGQPLPPPGMPLPRPTKPSIFSLPKKKPTVSGSSHADESSTNTTSTPSDSPPKPPALPERRRRQSQLNLQNTDGHDEDLLVVEAPQESAPTSPLPAGTLKSHGYNTTLLERTPENLLHNQGAGIVAGGDTIEFFRRYDRTGKPVAVPSHKRLYLNKKGDVIHEELNRQNMTSWDLAYYLLRANYDRVDSPYLSDAKLPEVRRGDGEVTYRYGCTVTSIKDEGDKVRVHFQRRQPDGKQIDDEMVADLVVAADGPSSTIRGMFEPEIKRKYAGYCVIRGTVPELEATQMAREVFTERFCFYHAPGIQNLTYTIAGENGNTKPGHRLLNFVWYANFPEGSDNLEKLMTDKEGRRRHITIPPGMIAWDAWEMVKRLGRDRLPPQMAEMAEKTKAPFVQCITDVITPKNLYMNDKVILIGDALAGFRPHTVASTSQGAFNAMSLVDWLDGKIDREQFVKQTMQFAREIQAMGVRIGNRSQFEELPVEEYIADRNFASIKRQDRVYPEWTLEGLDKI
ncbi:hypothetical protein LTR64_001096 [Lithohypha guttulata]|uniref:uncharacterized protein n=1 Tax=Lithohypha guttulata TaxID=1690604 RepID=UPI002DE17B28|nr:hypothetical protein LTR51_003290 [Lithohypha guttulata]